MDLPCRRVFSQWGHCSQGQSGGANTPLAASPASASSAQPPPPEEPPPAKRPRHPPTPLPVNLPPLLPAASPAAGPPLYELVKREAADAELDYGAERAGEERLRAAAQTSEEGVLLPAEVAVEDAEEGRQEGRLEGRLPADPSRGERRLPLLRARLECVIRRWGLADCVFNRGSDTI